MKFLKIFILCFLFNFNIFSSNHLKTGTKNNKNLIRSRLMHKIVLQGNNQKEEEEPVFYNEFDRMEYLSSVFDRPFFLFRFLFSK